MTDDSLPHAGQLRPGQHIRGIKDEVAAQVVTHHRHRENVKTVDRLLAHLGTCQTSEDLFEFQRHLFGAVFSTETHRAACSRIRKRLIRGERLPRDAPELPDEYDANRIDTWELEIFVAERVARQLRTVGDALAWRTFGFDRRVIIALSRNEPPGPMAGKDGLGYELGKVEELWTTSRHFALLHDLTTCLRISDLTEVAPKQMLLHEVKKKRRVPHAQAARAQAAVDAIMTGGSLPGSEGDARLHQLSTPFKADLRPIGDAIRLARERGAQGVGLPEGRMLFAASLADLVRHHGHDYEAAATAVQDARGAAIRRARLDRATAHWIGNSGDTAGRSPVSAPIGIFPISSADRAALICDLLTVECVLAVDELVGELQAHGLSVTTLLPEAHQQIDPTADVLQIRYRDRALVANSSTTQQLLFEFLRPSTWCAGVLELLRLPVLPAHPVMVFADEAKYWR